MKFSAPTFKNLTFVAGLAAVIAALAVPTALARPQLEGGGGDSNLGAQAVIDLRSPDTRDVTTQSFGLDPAIATAMAARQNLQVTGDLRSPDTRDVTVSPIVGEPVATSVTSDGTNWGLVAAMIAAIGLLIVGVGAVGFQGHGKRHGSVKPA
jgi:hypothetical protein